MLKARRDAAMKVAESLFAAEEAIDAALARAAELNGALVTARSEANLSAHCRRRKRLKSPPPPLRRSRRARCDIVETHKRLSETKIQIGLARGCRLATMETQACSATGLGEAATFRRLPEATQTIGRVRCA